MGIRRLGAVGLVVSALVIGAVGCSSGDDDAGAAGDAVEVDHVFGTTEVEGVPERIVSLSAQWTDVLLAMDVQPVGYLLDPNAGDTGVLPWQELSDEAEGIEVVGTAVPIEQIARLEPDLILGSWVVEDESVYDELSGIAPTIPLLGDRQVDKWQDMADIAGRILDDTAGADQVTSEVDQLMADTAKDLPGLAGKTFVMVNYVPGDQLYVVADPEDGSSVFFQDLGMTLDPELMAEAGGTVGRFEMSLEQATLLDSDLLVLFSNGGDPDDLIGYTDLPAVKDSSVADLDYASVVGLNTPSPLSIPYSLDAVLPALQAAAT